jgi:hypothetical protein
VAVGIDVPTIEGNNSGRGGQAVEGVGCEVGEHHGAKEELRNVASSMDDNQRGSSSVELPRMKKMETASVASGPSHRWWLGSWRKALG